MNASSDEQSRDIEFFMHIEQMRGMRADEHNRINILVYLQIKYISMHMFTTIDRIDKVPIETNLRMFPFGNNIDDWSNGAICLI